MEFKTITHGLAGKMRKLETAIFSSDSVPDIWGFPRSIVHFRRMDEFGRICFLVSKHYENMDYFETLFPAQLRFYNKAFSYTIELSGTASTRLTLAGIEVVFQIATQRMASFRVKSLLSRFKLLSNLLSQSVVRLSIAG